MFPSSPIPPTEKSFGLLFALVFSLIGIYNLYKLGHGVVVMALFTLAALFLVAALAAPNVLAPLNKAWFALGLLLGKIVSPIVLGVIFFLIITPVALITRYFGRDQLRLKKQNVDSYWIKREPIWPDPESFKNQF